MRKIGKSHLAFLISSFLFFFAAFNVFSLAIREEMNNANASPPIEAVVTDGSPAAGNTMTIQGRVQIYGNEPHTFVGIIDQNGAEYAVYPSDKEDELRSLQGHIIDFTVIMLDEPQGFGSLFLKGGTVTPVKWEIIR